MASAWVRVISWASPFGLAVPGEKDWQHLLNCNIDRLNESAWQDRFMKQYYLTKPAILQGWSSPALASMQAQATRDQLLERFGSVEVSVGSHWGLAQQGRSRRMISLREYAQALPGNDYLFDRGQFIKRTGFGMNWTLPPGLDTAGTYECPGDLRFAWGGHGQGIPFHWHIDSYTAQLHGQKRWAIYAPHNMTPTGFLATESFVTWLQKRRDVAGFVSPTWECMQQPGEVFYVPEGFFHATAAIGEAIAVVQQADDPTPSTAFGMFNAATRSDDGDSALALLQKAVSLDSSNAAILVEACTWYMDKGLLQQAARCYQQALKVNPLNPEAHKQLIELLEGVGETTKAHKAIQKAEGLGMRNAFLELDELDYLERRSRGEL